MAGSWSARLTCGLCKTLCQSSSVPGWNCRCPGERGLRGGIMRFLLEAAGRHESVIVAIPLLSGNRNQQTKIAGLIALAEPLAGALGRPVPRDGNCLPLA